MRTLYRRYAHRICSLGCPCHRAALIIDKAILIPKLVCQINPLCVYGTYKILNTDYFEFFYLFPASARRYHPFFQCYTTKSYITHKDFIRIQHPHPHPHMHAHTRAYKAYAFIYLTLYCFSVFHETALPYSVQILISSRIF